MIVAGVCIGISMVFVLIVYFKAKGINWCRINIIQRSEKEVKKISSSCIKKEDNLHGKLNYNNYNMKNAEKMRYIVLASVVMIAIGYIFFKNIYISAALSSMSLLYPKVVKKKLISKRKNQLNIQFRDLLQSVASSLSVGRSIEGAFRAALEDLKMLYANNDVFIINEVRIILQRLDMNETLRDALEDFAERADIDDIKNFSDVFIICSKSGGNLVDVIKNTSNIINQKIEIKNEINVLIAEQKFSQRILNIMPFALIILISSSTPEYIAPLYTLGGHAVMLLVLVLLLTAYYIGNRITDIKV